MFASLMGWGGWWVSAVGSAAARSGGVWSSGGRGGGVYMVAGGRGASTVAVIKFYKRKLGRYSSKSASTSALLRYIKEL